MKASDLRSGNFIQHKKDYWRINDIFGASGLLTVYPKNGESLGRRSIHDFEPIPITEEWLIKFGFNYRDGGYLHEHKNMYFTLTGNLPDGLDYYGGSGGVGADIKYVHQLQNLYFALTGEELELSA